MKVLTFNLLDKKTEYDFMPTLKAYILDEIRYDEYAGPLRPAVIVVPGGGYHHVSPREGDRIALAYSAAGFQTFILDYCVAPHRHPLPILDIAKAVSLVRTHADEWEINPQNIAVCGFSAGGHLAASISTLWNDMDIFGNDKQKNEYHKPNATILCYPVITGGLYAHGGSFANLTGSAVKNDLWESLSLENRVTADTPPTFIWHTLDDNLVPAENSLLYANSLKKQNIPFEMHIYPGDQHGISSVSHETYWGVDLYNRNYPWIKQSIEWLYLQFGIQELISHN